MQCAYGAWLDATLTWLACSGRKKYLDAQKLLLHALTCPSFVANAISVAAYKKFLLLSLILQGRCAACLPLALLIGVGLPEDLLLHTVRCISYATSTWTCCNSAVSGQEGCPR